MARKNPHLGSSFESWLDEAGIREVPHVAGDHGETADARRRGDQHICRIVASAGGSETFRNLNPVDQNIDGNVDCQAFEERDDVGVDPAPESFTSRLAASVRGAVDDFRQCDGADRQIHARLR